MSIPVESILARLKDLEIDPIIRDGELILRAKPNTISDRCKAIVRENKVAIVEYLSRPIPFENRIAALFPGGCTITQQRPGIILVEHLAEQQKESHHVRAFDKKPNWTPQEWQAACNLQNKRMREYQERLGTPIPVEESYVDEEGFVVVPEYRKWKRI